MPSAPTSPPPRPNGILARLTALLGAAVVLVALAGLPSTPPASAASPAAAGEVAAAEVVARGSVHTGAPPQRLVSTPDAGPDLSFVPGTASSAELEQVEALVGASYASLADVWAPVFGRRVEVGIRVVRPGAALEFSACNLQVPVNQRLTGFYCRGDDGIWLNDRLVVGVARRCG